MQFRLIAAFAFLLTAPTFSAEYKPYPVAEITVEQWQDYFDIVQSEFGESRKEESSSRLVLFRDQKTYTFYAFTMPSHPAHPAWVTRKIVDENGHISMIQIGYFAGEEEAFAELFRAYSVLADQAREKFEIENDLSE